MRRYDYIFAGAGVSGLATARALVKRFPDCRVALIDPLGREAPDHRSFGYWYEGPSLLPDGVGRTWDRWLVESGEASVEVRLGEWRYDTFDVHEWREAIAAELERSGDVTWIPENVSRIEPEDASVTAVTEAGARIEGTWIFDSRPHPPDVKGPVLWQSFLGWRVRTALPTFAPDTLFLMDFVPRQDAMQFSYVVPHSEDTGLVEAVITSREPHPPDSEFRMTTTMAEWTTGSWDVLSAERGSTALTTSGYVRRPAPRTVNIGLRGGAARPSTGYAFVRIHREAEELAESLARDGVPRRSARRRRDQFLDIVLLTVIANQPSATPDIFLALFARARTDRVLRLLDERASWGDIVAIVWALPWVVFLRALWQLALRRQARR